MTVMRGGTASPQQHRSTKRWDSFIDVTRDLILEEGERALTMKALSQIVGGSPAGIYRYFSNRVVLIDAVIQRDYDRLEALFTVRVRSNAGLTERDVLHSAVRAMVELRTSSTGSLALAMNSLRRKRGQDHISQLAWSIVTHVFRQTGVNVDARRIQQYTNLITLADAVLVRGRKGATATERTRMLELTAELIDLVCPTEMREADGVPTESVHQARCSRAGR